MKKALYIFLLFSLSALMQAQDVAISYEINSQTNEQATMQIFLQSLTDQDQSIRAINFSLALPAGCVKITGQEAIFSDAWTDYLQEVQMTEQLDLNYNNWHYSQRWQYGSADPGLPNTAPVIAPAQGNSPLLIMQISLEGSCADKLYLEQQQENPVNQMGDNDILPIKWTVIHPKTELSLENGLKLNIYPNPVKDFLNISVKGQIGGDYGVKLSSIDGKQIVEKVLNQVNQEAFSFDMSKLPSAVYILSIQQGFTDEQVKTIKILKQ